MELTSLAYSTTGGVPQNTNATTFDAILASVVGGISTYRATTAAQAELRAAEAEKINPGLNAASIKPVVIFGGVLVALYFIFEG